jgi:hypothetical protein
MPTYGIIQRAKPRLTVLRGYDPQEPTTRLASYPVADGVVIKSGQVISLKWNATEGRDEWVLGVLTDDAIIRTPYIALNDSTDEDVIEAGTLPALSCAGQFELRMGFFKDGDTYNQDIPLTFDGVTGNVKATTWASGAPVLGVVSRIHGPINLKGQDSSAVDLDVIVFNTQFAINTAPHVGA